jgi:hypothetical protein
MLNVVVRKVTARLQRVNRARNIAKGDYYFVVPVPSSARNNSATIKLILMKFDIGLFFENLSMKYKFH